MNDFFGPKIAVDISDHNDGPMNFVGHEAFDGERRANRACFAKRHLAIDMADCVAPFLSHGTNVLCVDKHNPVLEMVQADAIITDKKSLALTMTAADCPPILLYDPIAEVIGVIHGGWRSVAGGIVEKTIESMKANYNSDPRNIRAYIGPGICHKCFEIGPEVAKKFGWETLKNIFFNLENEISSRLLTSGLTRENISASPDCTVCTMKDIDRPKYFSWRRDHPEPLNCQMAVIMMK